MSKLTLVSFSVRGRQVSFFVTAPMVNGRAVVSAEVVQAGLRALGFAGDTRGLTIAWG